MASAVWSGHLHFGLVVVPVRLFVAARAKTTRFRRVHRRRSYDLPSPSFAMREEEEPRNQSSFLPESKETSDYISTSSTQPSSTYDYSRVRQVLQSGTTGEEIQPGELVKGYEYAPDQFAVIEPEAIKAAAVETSDTIDLFHFVKSDEVDPIYFERSYYLVPDPGGEKPYALLREAMQKEEYFGIARIGMHQREHMLILRPAKEYIAAHTMFYADEVRLPPEFAWNGHEANVRELSMASALIKAYAGKFKPEEFKDLYQERIKKIIEAEMGNTNRGVSSARPKQTAVPDLMESIRLSLAQIESKPRSGGDAKQKKPSVKSAATGKKEPPNAVA